MAACATDVNSNWNAILGGALVVAQFKSADDHIALVRDVDHSILSIGNGKTSSVDDGILAVEILQRDWARRGRSRSRDVDRLVVDATQHIDRITRPRMIRGILDAAPRRRSGQTIVR